MTSSPVLEPERDRWSAAASSAREQRTVPARQLVQPRAAFARPTRRATRRTPAGHDALAVRAVGRGVRASWSRPAGPRAGGTRASPGAARAACSVGEVSTRPQREPQRQLRIGVELLRRLQRELARDRDVPLALRVAPLARSRRAAIAARPTSADGERAEGDREAAAAGRALAVLALRLAARNSRSASRRARDRRARPSLAPRRAGRRGTARPRRGRGAATPAPRSSGSGGP